ncbi:hypothetical protein AB0O07_13290 [Streptomyces sp. NPDC093085]|uniref:hypothetical protein n=1 Tax=Streptomyces sp. NPDC093085 TaxID=3155068 RepID=UPI00341E8EB5
MLMPYAVLEHLSQRDVEQWKTFFVGGHDRLRSVEEGIWRRTQEPDNAEQSGWSDESDRRRRVVHYRYGYDLDYTHPAPRLVIRDSTARPPGQRG